MKKSGKNKFSALKLLGLISASMMLTQIAAAADDSGVQQQSNIPTEVEGTVLDTLPAGNTAQLQDSITALENKYDSETLNGFVLQVQEGQLFVIGVNADVATVRSSSPSGL